MKSKKKPLVAAAISALLALAGSVSAQGTTGSSGRQRKPGARVEGLHKARYRSRKGKKGRKAPRFRGRKGGKKIPKKTIT